MSHTSAKNTFHWSVKSAFASAIALGIACISVPAFALGPTVCKQGKLQRTLEIVYKEAGKKVPCEVKYTREGAGGATEEKVLYSAQAKVDYCEEKATEFAGKLTEKGWSCSQVDGGSGEATKPTSEATKPTGEAPKAAEAKPAEKKPEAKK